MKNDLLCTANKRIFWLSRTCDGSIHDKKIVDEQPLNLPMGITIWQDTGFLGHKPVNATVMMPTKKPEGRQLSDVQKEENRKIFSFRILVEHAIERAFRKTCCSSKKMFHHLKAFDLAFFYINFGHI